MRKNKLLFTIGIFGMLFWIADLVNMIFLIQKPEYALWYSSAGLFLTSLALLTQNPFLISTMFCALFVIEFIWSFDFFGKIFFDTNFLGITNYLFKSEYTKKDFFFAGYHIFIPPILIIGLSETKKVFRYAWVWASVFAVILAFLTIFLVNPAEDVNCVHKLTRCKGSFSFLFTKIPYPQRIFVALGIVTLGIYAPTNYMLLKLGNKLKWKQI